MAAQVRSDPLPELSPEDRAINHEMRTSLNAVIGFSEMICSEVHGSLGSSEYREYAQIVRDSGRKLVTLIAQIMDARARVPE